MAIVLYLGKNVKQYDEISKEIIKDHVAGGRIRCDMCSQPMNRHSSYTRGIRETGEKIVITLVQCRRCNNYHALLPDFLLPHKQYSGNEIESVIIDSATQPTNQIETEASESTVKRWIKQIGDRIKMAVSVLKIVFMEMGRVISEIRIETGNAYNELEQVLNMAPEATKYTNNLGLANIWLGKHSRKSMI